VPLPLAGPAGLLEEGRMHIQPRFAEISMSVSSWFGKMWIWKLSIFTRPVNL